MCQNGVGGGREVTRGEILNAIVGLVPDRVLNRPAVRVLRARLEAADKRQRAAVGPGLPIVGEIALDGVADWRTRFTAVLWSLARAAADAPDRAVWMLCVAASPEAPDELYALMAQASSPTQLHLMADAREAAAFRERYVPPASLREAAARKLPNAMEILTRIDPERSVFARATAVRAAAHTFAKRIGGEGALIAIHGAQAAAACTAYLKRVDAAVPLRLLVLGNPREVPDSLSADCRLTIARRAGFSLLDELALVRFCDGYVGPPDHYAIVAADGGVPCLLSSEAATRYRLAPRSRIRIVPDLLGSFEPWLARVAARPMAIPARAGAGS